MTIAQFVCLVCAIWFQAFVESAAAPADSSFLLILAFRIATAAWFAAIYFCFSWLILSKNLKPVDAKLQQQHAESLLTVNELIRTRDAIIFGLAKLAESRDPDTGQHLERISLYSVRMASALRNHPKYKSLVDAEFVRMIGISSVLHDIGKVGVEDRILLKKGRLTPDERVEMQHHPEIGSDCIRQIERRLGNSDFLTMAREIAMSHHERWDGTGYPKGLAQTEIPLAARIVAIADVYDALVSKRIYKDAMPHIDCVQNIGDKAGTQFDPDLIDVFLTIHEQFRDISTRFCDESIDFSDAKPDLITAKQTVPSVVGKEHGGKD
ncbi:MAG: HD domain-containing protein [Planctomycetaceae bacterium]|nr:HD domain-containing protein [Planctomycetaceae bacterium]